MTQENSRGREENHWVREEEEDNQGKREEENIWDREEEMDDNQGGCRVK